MLSNSQAVHDIYKLDGVHKEFSIVLGDNSQEEYNSWFYNDEIVDESIELKQSLYDGSSLDICGCVSSSLSFKIHHEINPVEELLFYSKGQKVRLYVKAGNTERLQLFTGYVDSYEVEANKKFISINAYDELYKLSGQAGMPNERENQYNITDWFNNHASSSISVQLGELLSRYDIQLDLLSPPLINGHITSRWGNGHKVSGISALDLLKDIMRINGCFGYMTGYGTFTYKYLEISPYDDVGILYPSDFLFPMDSSLYPGIDTTHSAENSDNYIGNYEKLSYQGFNVNAIDFVKVADYENDSNAGYAGTGSNRYFIYGNLCTLKLSSSVKADIAGRILEKIRGIFYTPFEATCIGLPYMQPGDEVVFYDTIRDKYHRFYILTRTLKCAQHMRDEYSASGDEYQHEFKVGNEKDTHEEESQDISELENRVTQNEDDILNMHNDIDLLDNSVDNLNTDYENLNADYSNYKTNTNNAIRDLQQGFQINLRIVSEVPANPARDTLYLIKGDTMIL